VLSASSLGLSATHLTSRAGSLNALAQIADAISVAAGQRGQVGAIINRLQAATDVMTAQTRYLTSARSEIMDADMSETLASLTRYDILESVTEAVLAQASRLRRQGILTLLRGVQQIGVA
ncbi:MAG: flagellin, partial [Acidobacteriota bacterium]